MEDYVLEFYVQRESAPRIKMKIEAASWSDADTFGEAIARTMPPEIAYDDFGNEEGIEEHEVNWFCFVE